MAAEKTMSMLEDAPLLILMDGHAMVHRAFHAIQEPMNVRRTGEEIGAVYGFINTFLRVLADLRPTHCAIAFDLSAPTFRHLEYDQYKAQRPPTPPELPPQIDHVRRLMDVFGVPIFDQKGYEADDVLGTLSRQAEERQIETIVLTGDTDELQLVSPWVRVLLSYSVQRSTLYDIAKVRERYGGLGPEAVADIKALQGDTSDNIPGVPAVGAKTAIKLLNEFGTVEGIFERIDEVKPPRIQQSLRDNRELALRGKFLTTIVTDVPVDLDLERARFWKYDRAEVVAALGELEFHSVVNRIPEPQGGGVSATQSELPMEVPIRETDYGVVDTPEALEQLVRELDSPRGFAFDTETTSTKAVATALVGISFSNSPNAGWYVPVGHDSGMQLPLERVLDALRPIMQSESVPKIAHNANFDMTVLARHGLQVENLAFDTMVAAHVGGRKSIGLKALALECLGVEMTPITELIGTGKKQTTMAQTPIERAAEYAAADADLTWQLYGIFSKEVEEKGVRNALETVEIPLVPVLVRMQISGVAIDSGHLSTMSVELSADISSIQAEMYDLVGHEFNIGSSQQLADVLFKELRLPPTKKTKTGFSTDAASLERLKTVVDMGEVADVDPKAVQVLDHVLEYRQLTKIKSTYVDSLPGQVNPVTGRIHTSYQQTGSATGRVSSNDPNVQNIPIRTELGRRVREAFIAENAPDWMLLGVDYSQIELRILAHLCRDPGLMMAFQSGLDIHTATASTVYGVPLDQVDADMRRIAKIMNFGVIYGLSPFGISRQTGLTAEEGKTFTDAYFGLYPGIREYIDSIKAQVNTTGYVETLMRRRRYIPEIRSGSSHVRAAGERMAINMPIQGTAADIIKLAMIRIQERMDALGLRAMMILQVHDELIFELPVDELEQIKAMVLELMPAAMELAVPLAVVLKTGYNWGAME
jgi:DNA polymerase-1